MAYSYQDCLDDTLVQIKKYNTARRLSQWDYWDFQEIRDELSQSLVFFGPYYSDIRADAEQAENDRKMAYEERKLFHRESNRERVKEDRVTAAEIESLAMRDIKDYYTKENQAKRDYYRARTLMERVDQVINGIASRLKPLDKYEKENR